MHLCVCMHVYVYISTCYKVLINNKPCSHLIFQTLTHHFSHLSKGIFFRMLIMIMMLSLLKVIFVIFMMIMLMMIIVIEINYLIIITLMIIIRTLIVSIAIIMAFHMNCLVAFLNTIMMDILYISIDYFLKLIIVCKFVLKI